MQRERDELVALSLIAVPAFMLASMLTLGLVVANRLTPASHKRPAWKGRAR